MFPLNQPISNWAHCVYGNSHWGWGAGIWSSGWGHLFWNELSAGKVWAVGGWGPCRGESAVPSRDLDAGVSLDLWLPITPLSPSPFPSFHGAAPHFWPLPRAPNAQDSSNCFSCNTFS